MSATQPSAVSDDPALAEFTEYFVKNYPGPQTIICDPNWHAPRIFRAAKRAITAAAPTPPGGEVVACGWVVANSEEDRFRAWDEFTGPCWTDDRDKALWFARRDDAEAFAAGDEDAWKILPVSNFKLTQAFVDRVTTDSDPEPPVIGYVPTPPAADASKLREVLDLLDNVTASTDTEADFLGQAENMLKAILDAQQAEGGE